LGLMGIFTTYTKSARLMVAEGREERIKPNFKNTAKEIWVVYVFLTIIAILLLFFAGMDGFDAINYAMSAISTTGMDTSSAGLIGVNIWISMIMAGIMIVGATSFSVHYLFLRKNNPGAYFKDSEFKVLITLLIISVFLIFPKFIAFYPDAVFALETAIFHSSSALTCGGI